MPKESTARSYLLANLHRHGLFAYPIESGSTALGISDVYIMHNRRAYWLECKRIKHDDWQTEALDFRPLQQKFLFDHYKAGGFGLVYLRTRNAHVFASIDDIDATKRIIGKHTLTLNTLNVDILIRWLETL